MTPAAQARKVAALNAQGRKVFDVVPVQEPWSKQQITSELSRRGMNVDRLVLDGCLGLLVSVKLARLSADGYIRVPVRTAAEVETVTEEIPVKKTPLEAMAALAIEARRSSESMARLADSIETLAIEIQAQLDAAGQDNTKLAQLRALLKEI